jgi:hypothetical protein
MTLTQWKWVISAVSIAVLLAGGIIGFQIGRATAPEPKRRFMVASFNKFFLYRYDPATGKAWTADTRRNSDGWKEIPESGLVLEPYKP